MHLLWSGHFERDGSRFNESGSFWLESAGPIQSNTCTSCLDQFMNRFRRFVQRVDSRSPSLTNRTSLQDEYGGVLTRGCGSGRLRWMWLSSMILLSRSQSSHPKGTRIGNVFQIFIIIHPPILYYYTHFLRCHCRLLYGRKHRERQWTKKNPASRFVT